MINRTIVFCLMGIFISLMTACKQDKPKNNAGPNLVKGDTLIIQLPAPVGESNFSVEEAFSERRSRRYYRDATLKQETLGQVLWAAYGITKPLKDYPFMRGGMRTAPSAGALYPLDIYVLVQHVKDIPVGIYKYKSDAHQLIQVSDKDKSNELCAAALNQEMVKEAPVCLIYTAIFERTTSKYGDRGRERYVWIDLGHSAENVYLQAEALHLGTCAIGAFNDKKVREVMDLPANEDPLYLMPLGRYYKKEME